MGVVQHHYQIFGGLPVDRGLNGGNLQFGILEFLL
jgi:hypothetical protein